MMKGCCLSVSEWKPCYRLFNVQFSFDVVNVRHVYWPISRYGFCKPNSRTLQGQSN